MRINFLGYKMEKGHNRYKIEKYEIIKGAEGGLMCYTTQQESNSHNSTHLRQQTEELIQQSNKQMLCHKIDD